MASDTKASRRYQAGVERALALFDAKNEWADYIAFLSRLLKALQAAPTGEAEIPSKTLLSDCLAQCLSPTLPAGVHQKALEVYDCIFGILGQTGLSHDLGIYLTGFSHTLTFASLKTRPWFLGLYGDHILKLPPKSLRPALKALILSLLPGIEEENSEDFDRTLGLLNRLRKIFASINDEAIFWQSFFLASIESSSRRGGALIYLIRHLPKLGHTEDAVHSNFDDMAHKAGLGDNAMLSTSVQDVVSPEPGLLFRCFATGLQDEQPLVQRGFLDLLVTHLPLGSPTLQKPTSRNDLLILVSAAMSIVLRRDMGLNRRLWAWFLGTDEKNPSESSAPKTPTKVDSQGTNSTPSKSSLTTSEGQDTTASSTYFSKFGLSSVTEALEHMLGKAESSSSQHARPFRLLRSLMDRSAIGNPTIDALFVKFFDNLRQYQTTAPTQDAFDEVFRSADVLFNAIEPRKLFKNIFQMMADGKWDLLEFIVFNFGLDDAEFGRIYLPAAAAYMSGLMAERDALTVKASLQIAMILDVLVEFVPVPPPSKTRHAAGPSDGLMQATLAYINEAERDSHRSQVSAEALLLLAGQQLVTAITQSLQESSQILNHLTSALGKLAPALPTNASVDGADLTEKILRWCSASPTIDAVSFALCVNVAALVNIAAGEYTPISFVNEEAAIQIIPTLVRNIWQYLQPSRPQYHVEAVKLLWSLRTIYSDLLLVDSTIMELITDVSTNTHKHPSISFGILWIHTKLPAETPQSTNGIDQEADRIHLLSKAAILIVDKSFEDTEWTAWLGSLPTLELHYQTVLHTIDDDAIGQEESLVGLLRLRRLIQIARSSTVLWKEIQVKQNLSQRINNLAAKTIIRHLSVEHAAEIALDILRIMNGEKGTSAMFDRDAESNGRPRQSIGRTSIGSLDTASIDSSPSSELINALTKQLPQTRAGSTLQSKFLDTLHTLMSRNPEGSLPTDLLPILMEGITNPLNDNSMEKWITLLCNSIPTLSDSSFFANLLKLTACFCNRTQAVFSALKQLFDADTLTKQSSTQPASDPERSIASLLSGLEYILARAHTKVVETGRPGSSDAAATGGARSRTLANHRLTVVLCMQDAIKVCCQMWFWRPPQTSDGGNTDTESFSYMSSRLRSRTRRMLENLLEAEPQECLETIMGIWVERTKASNQPVLVMNLLQTLNTARPKLMLPAIFNALYSRTNPTVLDAAQRSTLSVAASAIELLGFLIEYVNKLEDDLLEEIWHDCVSFMRDVLANPMPHRQLLLRLLEFLAALCAKMENTTFGEQSRMRRELADLITRLFTAIFTIKPGGMDQGSEMSGTSKPVGRLESGKGIDILLHALPVMLPVLNEGDRVSTVFQGISANITGPALRARSFPQTLENNVLGLYQIMIKGSANSKTWRKDLTEAFNDPRLFSSSISVAKRGWIPTIRQLSNVDRTLLPETVSKFVAPATAGIMFGVGASAARTEADKTTKINLRRLALLLMSQEQDFFAGNLSQILPKIDELRTATPSSSPSSSTRGDTYLLLRAMVLSYSEETLVSLWPVIVSEFRKIFADLRNEDGPDLSPHTHLQAAKLLDLLLLLKPEEFLLHKWLFITDTTDAIYPPADFEPVAAADLVRLSGVDTTDLQSSQSSGLRKPWLATDLSRQSQAISSLLLFFYSQLSIRGFEGIYSLESADMLKCRDDVVADLFSDAESAASQ